MGKTRKDSREQKAIRRGNPTSKLKMEPYKRDSKTKKKEEY